MLLLKHALIFSFVYEFSWYNAFTGWIWRIRHRAKTSPKTPEKTEAGIFGAIYHNYYHGSRAVAPLDHLTLTGDLR